MIVQNILYRGQAFAILVLLVTGFALIGQGGYSKIKARVADWLISSTWATREQGAAPIKPWPWADTWVVATIQVPRLGISQLIMKDASGESLAFGPGSIRQDAIPAGPGHSVIAGHRDTHFRFLSQLVAGDQIRIENYSGQQQNYRITDMRVIDSRVDSLTLNAYQRGLTLVTCWPFDALIPGGPLRYVIDTVTTE